ncbi:hypothetical protein B0H16DRAFT_729600 [Mycena metata]|uniref:MACPF-like domain-containing protein n=1 Tax=Mycena metata TaxID=1033252 RepID=A0AAD7K7M0_9AGAR|nr:hypothetical protein B0H16DRAFT_729600 [Mycena metata]
MILVRFCFPPAAPLTEKSSNQMPPPRASALKNTTRRRPKQVRISEPPPSDSEHEDDWEDMSDSKSETILSDSSGTVGSTGGHGAVDHKSGGEEVDAQTTEYRLKVYMLEQRTAVTTLEFDSPNPTTFGKTQFAAVRSRLGNLMDAEDQFCDEDGSVFQDHQTLGLYFKGESVDVVPDVTLKIYVKPSSGSAPLSRILKKPPFLLKFMQKLSSDETKGAGTLHSSKLNGASAGRLLMSDVRRLMTAMSRDPKIHKFCLDDGHAVEDSITLADYISLLNTATPDPRNGTPIIEIYFTKHDSFNRQSKWHEAEISAPDVSNDFADRSKFEVTREAAPELLGQTLTLDAFKPDNGSSAVKSAGMLSEEEWRQVLRNCNVFYGWIVDVKTNQVRRAPKPAFQLRPGLNLLPDAEAITVQPDPKPKAPKPAPVVKEKEEWDVTRELDADEEEEGTKAVERGGAVRKRFERPASIARPSYGAPRTPRDQIAGPAPPEAAGPAAPPRASGAQGQETASEDDGDTDESEPEDEDSESEAEEGVDVGLASEASGDDSEVSDANSDTSDSESEASAASESEGNESADEEPTENKETLRLRKEKSDLRRQNALLKKTLRTLHDILDGGHRHHSHAEEKSSSGSDESAEADSTPDSDESADEQSDEEGTDKDNSVVSTASDSEGRSEDEGDSASEGEPASENEASPDDEEPASDDDAHAVNSTTVGPVAVPFVNSGARDAGEDSSATAVVSDHDHDELGSGDEEEENAESDSEEPQSTSIAVASKPSAIPNFAVDDRSKVEVVSVVHDFEMSMATNHFTSTSASGSVGGGYGGVSAEVKASFGTEESNENKEGQTSSQTTMIATYKYPRATIYLTAEDLVPTDELKAALELVGRTKDITDLRKLHAHFGHLFCQQVLVGGALQSTKISNATSKSSEKTEKEAFRASVGFAVKSPYVTASGEVSHENGSAKSAGQTEKNISESVVFEATGGNTLLASYPLAWIDSVMDHKNWRVIEQTGLTPLTEVISAMPNWAHVPQWIAQAIPIYARYINIPQHRTLNCRLKASIKEDEISRQESISRIAQKKVQGYLAHRPQEQVWPVRCGLELRKTIKSYTRTKEHVVENHIVMDITPMATQVDSQDLFGLFSPSRTQAPVLQLYDDVCTATGPKGDADPTQTVWKMLVPDGNVLQHGARISIQSLATASGTPTLTVYRNQQGVFLPAMTSNEGPSFWRILKTTDNARDGDPIQDGEVIRLCWRFADQTDGFRDFFDDAFGRRRFTKPDGVGDVLYLKVPFPRFENTTSSGMALVMSDANIPLPFLKTMDVLPNEDEIKAGLLEVSLKFNLHDLLFRLDSVGNSALGEALDYMTAGVDQTAVKHLSRQSDVETGETKSEYQPEAPPPMASSTLAGPLGLLAPLGPLVAPLGPLAPLVAPLVAPVQAVVQELPPPVRIIAETVLGFVSAPTTLLSSAFNAFSF